MCVLLVTWGMSWTLRWLSSHLDKLDISSWLPPGTTNTHEKLYYKKKKITNSVIHIYLVLAKHNNKTGERGSQKFIINNHYYSPILLVHMISYYSIIVFFQTFFVDFRHEINEKGLKWTKTGWKQLKRVVRPAFGYLGPRNAIIFRLWPEQQPFF